MLHEKDLDDELDWQTNKISSQVWTLNLGVLGTTWTLLIATTNTKLQFQPAEAFPILFLCITSLISEMLQYLCAYTNARLIQSAMKKEGRKTFEYDETAFFYRLRMHFFYLKIIATMIAAGLLLWKIFIHLTQ